MADYEVLFNRRRSLLEKPFQSVYTQFVLSMPVFSVPLEAVENSLGILNAVLGHKYHPYHPN